MLIHPLSRNKRKIENICMYRKWKEEDLEAVNAIEVRSKALIGKNG